MNTSHLIADELELQFGSYVALNKVSFGVKQGEFFVLLGPSGCGKSTLLRAVSGLETLDDGKLSISGKNVVDVHPRDRNIAMIFQNYALYPHMTVKKNIAYPMHVAKVPKEQQQEKIDEIAELLELSPLLDRKPAELSGGQRQRVAMGRALVRKPEMFLMDEPLSNLDAKLRQQMRFEIKKLQRELGITTLYVTHDQVEAMTMADRIMIMNKGQIEQIGTPKDVYKTPASLFVAAFIGSPPMNFIRSDALAEKLLQIHGIDHSPSDVVVAVRPESLSKDSSGIEMSARCVAAEGLGAETLCHMAIDFDCGGYASTDYTFGDESNNTITVKWSGDHTHVADTQLKIGIEPKETLLYSQSTERLLIKR